MLRHRLAALFEPQSLLVLSDRTLPISQHIPPTLQHSITLVTVRLDSPIALPQRLNGLQPGTRLDLALLCVGGQRLGQALRALALHRPRALILLACDDVHSGPIQDIALSRTWGQLNDCLVLGPRSFGVQRPYLEMNLSHALDCARTGSVALVAQSRSLVAAVLDWAQDIQLGFSAVISIGDESTLSLPDVLDYLAMDPNTDSIVLCLEITSAARELTSALRAAASVKPVVVLKSGHGSQGARTAENAVFNALLRRVGAVRVPYFVQLFSAIKVLRYTYRPRGRRIALFSNDTGAPPLALDVMGVNAAVFRAELSETTINQLGALLERGAQVQNPVVTQAPLASSKVGRIISVLAADEAVDGVLVLLSPDPLTDMPAVVRQLALVAPGARKPVITCLMGEATMRPLRRLLDDVGTPAFRTPESAANAFGVLAAYHYNQSLSQQILPPEPLGRSPKLDAARQLIKAVRDDHRQTFTLAECVQLFHCFHIPIHAASSLETGLTSNGVLPTDVSMAIGVYRDASFGPYIKFGAGGRSAIFSGGRAIDLPPLNSYLASQLVQRSAIWRYVLSQQMSPVAVDCLYESIERISDLICELPDVECLSVDPLVADDTRLTARSISIELTASTATAVPEATGYRHMAIHPYPRRLVQAQKFDDGRLWTMRPIRPEDAAPLQAFVRGLSQESRYMRFVSMLRELTPHMLSRYTRIDYDRELALVATVQALDPRHSDDSIEQIIGFAHYLRNRDGRGAEYALVIGDDWQRCGLGTRLMGGLIEAARMQGLAYVDGYVLTSNSGMLSLLTRLGFQNDSALDDPTMRRVWLDLNPSTKLRPHLRTD